MVNEFIEVYESSAFSKLSSSQQRYSLREVFINLNHIVCFREDFSFCEKLKDGVLPKDLDKRQRFTRLHLNRGNVGIDVIVVGDPNVIKNKIIFTGGVIDDSV